MALVLNLKCVENLKGKTDRIARVTFREHTYNSKVVASAKKVAYFGETFEWPVARAVETHELILIEVINYSKYLTNKPIGTFSLSMQQLIYDGVLQISEPLTNANNQVTEEIITFEARYYSPDGKVGDWENREFEYPLIEDHRTKEEADQSRTGNWLGDLGDDDLLENPDGLGTNMLPGEDTVSQTMMLQQMYEIKKKRPELVEQELHKPRDYQICVTIIEGMQLAGLDIDPVIRLEVGQEKKYTTIKQSTNNPFYNEYFVFDFFESPAMICDKMVTITALHSIKIPGRQVFKAGNLLAGRVIGQFKCDVGTVYSAPDHNFYHKWAVLVDPKDTSEGAKGYVKCDISVLGRGDVLRIQKHSSKEDDSHNLDGNLLLPKGVPMDRQRAVYQLIVFRAEDLPRTDLGIMASVRKAIGGSSVAFIDAFIKVSFAGHVGKTTVKKNYNPEWREILTFMDLFPPLCNRIKIQVCDSDVTTDDAIGTHFIELSQIMDPGSDTEGILPTYGPNWVNFYGAPRNFKFIGEQHDDLNEGLGEGAAYRGRVLIALKTEIVDNESAGPTTVIREKLRTSTRTDVAPRREFILFGTFFEATMIDKELSAKPISFEMSIGQYGNILDAKSSKSMISDEDNDDDEEEEGAEEQSRLLKQKKQEEDNLPCQSCTPVEAALPMDKNYCFIPFNDNKPCTYVVGVFEDLRKRLYHMNLLESLVFAIEDGLEDVRQMLKDDIPHVHRRLRGVLGEFINGVDKYIRLAGSLSIGSGSGKTKLDKYRQKMCRNTMEKLRNQAETLKSKTGQENVREKYRDAREIARRVRQLSKEPQQSIPDVFIWMISEKKRIAYYRFAAKDLLDATDNAFKGKHCGKLQTIFLKKPGKKHKGSSGWVMQAKVEVLLWLGMRDDRRAVKAYLENVPKGYELTHEMKMSTLPPTVLHYPEYHTFQLRAYLFQARSLLGSDDTGLSDPFARVLISNQCQSTQVIECSLSPTWDETLVFRNIVLYGPIEEIVDCPPLVIVEVFDYDTVGKPEFLGRAMVKPKVKPGNVDYDLPEFPPQLQWWDVHRGPRQAGEILASFELLQNRDNDDRDDNSFPAPPMKVPFKYNEKVLIIPLPKDIKPTLSWHRLEACIWGIRELRKIQLLSVDHPRVQLECAGKLITSKRIEDINKNSNFDEPVLFANVELPDNTNFWPPITIRVVDCRKFGREVLVGVHTIGQILQYVWISPEQQQNKIREEEDRKRKKEKERHEILSSYNQTEGSVKMPSVENLTSADSVIINMDNTNLNDTTTSQLNIAETNQSNNNNKSVSSLPTVSYQQPGATNIPSNQQQSNQTTVNMPPAVDQTNSVIVQQTAPDGTPIPPGSMPNGQPPGLPQQMDPEQMKRKKKKRKDLLADLDWWSKYYVTKEDFDKELNERRKNDGLPKSNAQEDPVTVTSDSSDEELLAESGYRDHLPDMLDYSSLDATHIQELQELAAERRKQEDEKMDKKKKKKKKSKTKKAKKQLNKLKGVFNDAFEDEAEEDNLDSALVQEDDMDDKSHILRFTYYDCELEKVKTFGGFTDHFQTFDLFRGKKLDDDDDDDLERISGKFKGNFCIYKIDKPADADALSLVSMSKRKLERPPELKLNYGLPSFKPIEVQVFVYIVKASDLHPTDLNGKADPYLILKCGRREINDKANKQNNQLNPVFGKMYEFDACFPMDSIMHIQVMDYDLLSADDLIGETSIDLENRLFSRHRATCGISTSYDLYGYNIWRDTQKPSQIVEKLCKQYKVDQPKYQANHVNIGGKTFYGEDKVELESGELLQSNEHLSLEVLNHWDELSGGCKLLPEHLETRILHSPERPGVEQGKLEMWIDLYPKDLPAPNITVDITPRLPKEYELRVIIWNTDDVVLEDTNFVTGEQSSDIFVRGYLLGKGEDDQQTDVHYRSLTGEGNFNWRFIFPFQYLKAEEKVMYKKKMSIFDLEETEIKVPPKFTMQVWDADLVSSDDFLGSISLDLNRVPRPAKDAKKCKINMLKKDGTVPTLNLFKNKRCKGWWPFGAKDSDGARLVGKVEAEIHLLTIEEADKSPAGLGREEPDQLPEPNRPDSSFLWFMNPLKTCQHVLCRNYKWLIIKIVLLVLLVLFLGLMIYNIPGATVNAIFGA